MDDPLVPGRPIVDCVAGGRISGAWCPGVRNGGHCVVYIFRRIRYFCCGSCFVFHAPSKRSKSDCPFATRSAAAHEGAPYYLSKPALENKVSVHAEISHSSSRIASVRLSPHGSADTRDRNCPGANISQPDPDCVAGIASSITANGPASSTSQKTTFPSCNPFGRDI